VDINWYGCTEAHTGRCCYGSSGGNAYLHHGDCNAFYARDFNYYGMIYTYASLSESADGMAGLGGDFSTDAGGNYIPVSTKFHIVGGWSVSNTGASILKVNGEDYVLYSGPVGHMEIGEAGVGDGPLRFPAGHWNSNYTDWTYGGEVSPDGYFDFGYYSLGRAAGSLARYQLIEEFILDTNMWYGRTSQVSTDDGYATMYHTSERDQEEYPVFSSSGLKTNNLDRGVKYWYLDEDRQICMYTYQRKWVPLGVTLSCYPDFDPSLAGPHPRSAAGTGAQTDYEETEYGEANSGVYALWASGNVLGWGIVYAGDGWSDEKRGNHIHTESVDITQSTNFPRYHTGVEMPEGGGSSWISFSKGLCKRIQMIKIREGEEYELAV